MRLGERILFHSPVLDARKPIGTALASKEPANRDSLDICELDRSRNNRTLLKVLVNLHFTTHVGLESPVSFKIAGDVKIQWLSLYAGHTVRFMNWRPVTTNYLAPMPPSKVIRLTRNARFPKLRSDLEEGLGRISMQATIVIGHGIDLAVLAVLASCSTLEGCGYHAGTLITRIEQRSFAAAKNDVSKPWMVPKNLEIVRERLEPR